MARRQPFAAFGATTLENEPTTFGAHPLTKPMSFGATTIVWLVSPLHKVTLQDKVRVLENGETNNRVLLCQGSVPGFYSLSWLL
jgi:hypothetical protein